MNEQATPEATGAVLDAGSPRELPSGRSVIVKFANGQEQLEVRNPDGFVEVHIVLSDQGPIVRLRGAKLELQSTEELSIQCKKFAVQAEESASVQSSGPVRVNGEMIYLNCDEANASL